MKLTESQKYKVKSYIKYIKEARDEKYAEYEVKKDKIIATVSGQKASAFTSLAKSWKALDNKVTELENKKRELNELKNSVEAEESDLKNKIKDKILSIYDDSESAMTLTVECLNSTFTLSKLADSNQPTKTANKGDIISTDYKKVIELLVEQNSDLKDSIDLLIKQCSVLASEDIWKAGKERGVRVNVGESLLQEGIWEKIASTFQKIVIKVKSLFSKVSARQKQINKELLLLGK